MLGHVRLGLGLRAGWLKDKQRLVEETGSSQVDRKGRPLWKREHTEKIQEARDPVCRMVEGRQPALWKGVTGKCTLWKQVDISR